MNDFVCSMPSISLSGFKLSPGFPFSWTSSYKPHGYWEALWVLKKRLDIEGRIPSSITHLDKLLLLSEPRIFSLREMVLASQLCGSGSKS